MDIKKIVTDVDTQPRVNISRETVQDYREEIEHGAAFPPIKVFEDPDTKAVYLVEGFHRLEAMKQLGAKQTHVVVITGTVDEARAYAAGSNIQHGLRRTAGDKRKAIHMILANPVSKDWSSDQIAEYLQVGKALVDAIRISTAWEQPEGLYGPDDLAKPPAPDMANEDAMKTRERAVRSARKLLRFCEKISLDPVELLRLVLAEIEEKKKPQKKEPSEV
jgi:hypothetical protein